MVESHSDGHDARKDCKHSNKYHPQVPAEVRNGVIVVQPSFLHKVNPSRIRSTQYNTMCGFVITAVDMFQWISQPVIHE